MRNARAFARVGLLAFFALLGSPPGGAHGLGGAPTAREVAFLSAARRGDAAAVEALVRAGVDRDTRDLSRRTALMLTAARGSAATIRVLIAAGADLDAATPSGETALLAAVFWNHPEIVRILLDAGADPDARHRSWGTPLDCAAQKGHAEVVRLLRRGGARGSGKSVGDTVCVRLWHGQGFCGTVLDTDGLRFRLRVTRIEGCRDSCQADTVCSEGRPVGGDGVAVGDVLRTPRSCLTHTGVAP